MFQRYINFRFLENLNRYDLIHQNMYTSYYIVPQYTDISFKIFLKGFFNFKLFRKYLINFLLLYFFCFNFPITKFKLKKIKNRKRRIYKVKLFLNYIITKKKIFLTIFNLFFIFNNFARSFFFFKQHFIFSKFIVKLLFINYKIIIFLPYSMLFDHVEQSRINFFKKSKIFLTCSLKNNLAVYFYDFFYNIPLDKFFFKNISFFWCLL